MSTLTTKATISLATALAGLVGTAGPALASDPVAATVTPAETVAHAVRGGGLVLAAAAGVVLLSKAAQGYRRSQWRRRWMLRSTAWEMPGSWWRVRSSSVRRSSRLAAISASARARW